MKISIEDTNLIGKVTVLLNGKDYTNYTIEADDENGYIIKYKLDNNTQPHIVNNEFATETIYGEVEILKK